LIVQQKGNRVSSEMLNENICQISWNASGEKLAVATSISGVNSIKLNDESNVANYFVCKKLKIMAVSKFVKPTKKPTIQKNWLESLKS
jgi:hypothetical protein